MGAGAQIACKVARGMFSTERVVRIDFPDGKSVSALVDEDKVIVKADPKPGEFVDGKVKISIVEKERGFYIIDLPGTGITNGTRVRVPESWIRK